MKYFLVLFMFVSSTAIAGFDTRTYKAQSILNFLNYPAGTADGLWGNKTKNALEQFSDDFGISYSRELNDQLIVLLEQAYSDRSGKFPLFGSKGVDLPLKMPRKALPNGNSDWNELLKTELHNVDIFQGNFEPINWQNYVQATNAAGFDDGYTLAMIKGADCVSMNYEFRYIAQLETPEPYAWCNYSLRTALPKVGPSALQSIFDHWSNNSPEDYAPNYVSSTNSYILQQHYAQLTTTYALFYDQFNNHEAIDKWLVEWGTKYENTKTKKSTNNCPYHDPFVMKRDKIRSGKFSSALACGSQKWRGSIARIALGLRIKNKDIYLSGVRQLEALLGMFDKNGIFVHYATRGWDSLGYTVDVPNYLADLALLFEGVEFNFYAMETNSGFTVGELIDKTNDFLKNPQNYTAYFEGTRNERPGEQPNYFGSIEDYGGVEQWRRERASTDKELALRSFHYHHYKLTKGKSLPDYIAPKYETIIRAYLGKNYIPHNMLFGWTSAVPQILSVIASDPKIWLRTFRGAPNQKYFETYRYKDRRKELTAYWGALQREVNFDLEKISNLGAQNLFYETQNAKRIDFDVFLVPDGATRGLYGADKNFDRKSPLKIAIDNVGNVSLVDSTNLTELGVGSKLGKVEGDLLFLDFKGRHCDRCTSNEQVSIVVSLPLFLGVSNSSAENGQKILLRPMQLPDQKFDVSLLKRNDHQQETLDMSDDNSSNSATAVSVPKQKISLPDAKFFEVNGLGQVLNPITLGKDTQFEVFFGKAVEGFLDRKMPITLRLDGSNTVLVNDGFIVDDWESFGSNSQDGNIIISFRGYSCDDCEARDVKILINPTIGLGISLTSEKGYRTLLVRK